MAMTGQEFSRCAYPGCENERPPGEAEAAAEPGYCGLPDPATGEPHMALTAFRRRQVLAGQGGGMAGPEEAGRPGFAFWRRAGTQRLQRAEAEAREARLAVLQADERLAEALAAKAAADREAVGARDAAQARAAEAERVRLPRRPARNWTGPVYRRTCSYGRPGRTPRGTRPTCGRAWKPRSRRYRRPGPPCRPAPCRPRPRPGRRAPRQHRPMSGWPRRWRRGRPQSRKRTPRGRPPRRPARSWTGPARPRSSRWRRPGRKPRATKPSCGPALAPARRPGRPPPDNPQAARAAVGAPREAENTCRPRQEHPS
jgi:hypothetical protein